ncbi:hypothetical protein ACUHMQ_13515 [Chitinimonas sp. PSY-7]|uniref:hypothetical protein n=1 Tax=Chitinimonas sp. PSY-7 TaxID=3459088 RepID=UPI004040060A
MARNTATPDESISQPDAEAPAAPGISSTVPVRLLVDSPYGKANTVIDLAEKDVASAVKAGLADNDPEAVAYARSQAAV